MNKKRTRKSKQTKQPKWITRLSFAVDLSDWSKAREYKAAFKFLDKVNKAEGYDLDKAQVHAHSSGRGCRQTGRAASAGYGRMNLCYIKGLEKSLLIHEMAHLTAGARHWHDEVWAGEYLRLIAEYLKGANRREAISNGKNYNSVKRLLKEQRKAARATRRIPSFDQTAVYTQIN